MLSQPSSPKPNPHFPLSRPQFLELQLNSLRSRKNFASSDSGATIVAKKHVTNSKSILEESSDTYLIMPDCNGQIVNSITIHLCEDVTVDSIVLSH